MSDAETTGAVPHADDELMVVEEAELPVASGEVVDERNDAERQRDDYIDALQRLQADFENYRKRVVRAADEAADRAAGSLVRALLPVLDALDLAEEHLGALESEEAVALRQTRDLLVTTLAKEGLDRIDATGVSFDPTVHEAVSHEADDEGGDQHVAEVLRAGYQWRGTVLRAAMVRVRG